MASISCYTYTSPRSLKYTSTGLDMVTNGYFNQLAKIKLNVIWWRGYYRKINSNVYNDDSSMLDYNKFIIIIIIKKWL